MGLLYVNEHTNCRYYLRDSLSGFHLYKYEKGYQVPNSETSLNYIIFLLKGKIRFQCNEFNVILSAGEMLFVPRNSNVRVSVLEESESMISVFDNATHLCTRSSISELSEIAKTIKFETKPFEIKEQLMKFLELLKMYLDDKANCRHIHEIKLQELFWVLRLYYSKEELASFLYYIVGNSFEFREKVYQNYTKAATVEELAKLCNVALPTFKRQFDKEFGEAPYTWMQKRRVSRILFFLSDPDIPLKTIADDQNFPSLSHLVRFCKKYIGKTPGELRKTEEKG